MHNEKDHGYIDKVREETSTYVRALLHDVDKLRISVAELESENTRLQQELRVAREEIAFHASQESRLDQKLQEIRLESEQRIEQYAQLEQHNSNLANLYVASYQLHGTVDRGAVVAAIEEIVVNLVGSEEFAIFSREEGSDFHVVAAVGLQFTSDLHRHDANIREAIETGRTWVREEGTDSALTACIPLKLDDEVTGYVAIYRLLPHKQTLDALDHELFDLLATHAATALYCTSLQDRLRLVAV